MPKKKAPPKKESPTPQRAGPPGIILLPDEIVSAADFAALCRKGESEAATRHPPSEPILAEPLPDSPTRLLQLIQELRCRLKNAGTVLDALASGPRIVDWFWNAMRHLGGIIPAQPMVRSLSESQAFVEALKNESEPVRELGDAVDVAANWCYEQQLSEGTGESAKAARGAAEQGEGASEKPKRPKKRGRSRNCSQRRQVIILPSCQQPTAKPNLLNHCVNSASNVVSSKSN